MRYALWLVLSIVLTTSHVVAQDQSSIRVGVIDLTGQNLTPAELAILSDRLRVELHDTGVFTVVERERMEDILAEQSFQLSGCVDTYCVVEVGRLLGAQKMVAGSIGRLGDVYTMSLRLVDIQTGALERTALRDCECSIQEVLTRVVGEVAAELAGLDWAVSRTLKREEGEGILFIESTPSGGRISLDGRPSREITPATLLNVPAGEHIVRVVHDHLFAEQQVIVIRDELTKLSFTLQPGKGSVFIETYPPGAEAYFDGRPVGTTPVLIGQASSGTHHVRITKPYHLEWEEEIHVDSNRRADLTILLNSIVDLRITSTPPGASISSTPSGINGITPYSVKHRESGRYTITLSMENRVPYTETVDLEHGKKATIHGRLSFTEQYLQRLEAERRIAAAKRQAAIKRGTRFVSFACAAFTAAVAYKFNVDAQSAYDDARAAHASYSAATTTAEAVSARNSYESSMKRGDDATKKRNVFYGVSGALLSVGVTLWVF